MNNLTSGINFSSTRPSPKQINKQTNEQTIQINKELKARKKKEQMFEKARSNTKSTNHIINIET